MSEDVRLSFLNNAWFYFAGAFSLSQKNRKPRSPETGHSYSGPYYSTIIVQIKVDFFACIIVFGYIFLLIVTLALIS